MTAITHKGLGDGVTYEWTIIAKVKPGQEKALRQFATARFGRPGAVKDEEDIILPVGTVHDYRWVLFDDDTRIMFMSSFDGDWSQYIDDFFAMKLVAQGFDSAFSYCEGYPGSSAPIALKKEWMQAHSHKAEQYSRAYHGTVKEMWKALDVQKAFQQVLDDPAAVKALKETPALKPLLNLAAT